MIKELTMEKTSLPVGWEMKIFDEVINFSQIGLVRNNKEQSLEYDFRYLKMNNINNDNGLNEDSFKFVNATNEEVEKYQLVNDDFLFNTRNSFELVGKNCLYQSDYKKPTLFNNNILRVRFKEFLVPEFVAYAFSSKQLVDDLEKLKSGTTNVVGIYYKSLKNLEIPVPPLPQQKQIVEILDKAFAAIELAKANAEQNLQNSKELFESYLQNIFENKGDNWAEKNLGEVVNIKTGKLNSNAMVENGKYPFFTCSRKIFSIDEYAFDCKAVLLAGNNASGDFNVKYYEGKFNAYQRTYVITINNENELLYSYLKHKLLFHLSVFKKQSLGANTKFLKLGMIKGVKIILPPIEQQKEIIKNLDAISLETKKLEAIYTKKIADLEEMKKSVLQKAFSGQLNTIN